jgi:hypothetical protein
MIFFGMYRKEACFGIVFLTSGFYNFLSSFCEELKTSDTGTLFFLPFTWTFFFLYVYVRSTNIGVFFFLVVWGPLKC